jgi:hypothetical protein
VLDAGPARNADGTIFRPDHLYIRLPKFYIMAQMKETFQKKETRTVDLVVDKVPYLVKITPEKFNDDPRFFIEVNGDGGHMYAWYPDLVRLHALDDEAATLPDGLEAAISNMIVKTTYIK